jgi:SpoVK/Ycf46/Vps4 family AAA+-type ATPase
MAILETVLRTLPRAQDGVLLLLANETKNVSGATLTKICQRAHKSAIRESIEKKKKCIGTIGEQDAVIEIRSIHFQEAIEFFQRLEFNRHDIPK